MNEPIENEAVTSKEHLQSPSQMPLEVEQRKGFHPFYILPILYVISTYLLLLASMGQITFSNVMYLPVFLGIISAIVSSIFYKPENRRMMFNALVLVKYAMLPLFIIGDLMLIMYTLSFFKVMEMDSGILSLFVVISFISVLIEAIVAVKWLLLILVLEAPYAIFYLGLSVKAGIYRKGLAVLFGILQFFFIIDVIVVMILTFKEQKWKKLTLGVLVLIGVFILVLYILNDLGIRNIAL